MAVNNLQGRDISKHEEHGPEDADSKAITRDE